MSRLSFLKSNSSLSLFLNKLAWVLAGEGVIRISRLLTAIVLARYLSPMAFGVVALVLTIDEVIKVLTRNGVGQKIIQCQDSELNAICKRAYQLNWLVHIAIFFIIISIVAPLSDVFNYPELKPLLIVLSCTYLIYPLSMVQVNLLYRQQKMKKISLFYSFQVGLDNLLTAVLVIAGYGIWSVIIPKLIVAPLWVILFRQACDWRYTQNKNTVASSWTEFRHFALPIFAVELLKTARQYADRLLIGLVFGLEALGMYYFAVNAGSGLSLALVKAFSSVVLPDMCAKARKLGKSASRISTVWSDLYRQASKRYSQFIVPIILLQFVLAPWYVPFVFGEQWVPAIVTLMILCAASIFQGFLEIGSQTFRSSGQTSHDFSFHRISTAIFFIALFCAVLIGSQTQAPLIWISIAILIHSGVFACLHAKLIQQVFSSNTSSFNVNSQIIGGGSLYVK